MKKEKKKSWRKYLWLNLLMLGLAVVIVLGGSYGIRRWAATMVPSADQVQGLVPEEEDSRLNSQQEISQQEESRQEESIPEDSSVEEEVFVPLSPHAVEGTHPSDWIADTAIYVNDELQSTYHTSKPITMNDDLYSELNGIFTFRGNNFRNTAAYGTIQTVQQKFDEENSWSYGIGTIETPDGSFWPGTGWTGQPLMRCWSRDIKEHMNMYDWAIEKDDLVEVIYAALDGYIYFLDLDTGEETRPPLYMGYTFKGAGSLDPRGYPILYVGSGYDGFEGQSRAFIINLLDCSVMYTFGNGDPVAPRYFSYFDSSALVCAETDQLIYPGENGVLYIMTLNTQFDPEEGTLQIAPDPVIKWTYHSNRWMWPGMEDSAIIYQQYLYIADNGGNLLCLDLETLELKWVQDVLDDTNCTPVLEVEDDGKAYLYISTSFHAGWRATEEETAVIPIWKIDAETGEVVWSVDYDCWTIEDLSGGVQGSIASGEGSLSEYIYVPVSRTPDAMSGRLVCLRKTDGEVVWEYPTAYSWSSPVCVYDQQGRGYVINADFNGDLHLVDGLTGEALDVINLGSNIESSPAVYENRLVVGTRGQLIWGISFQ